MTRRALWFLLLLLATRLPAQNWSRVQRLHTGEHIQVESDSPYGPHAAETCLLDSVDASSLTCTREFDDTRLIFPAANVTRVFRILPRQSILRVSALVAGSGLTVTGLVFADPIIFTFGITLLASSAHSALWSSPPPVRPGHVHLKLVYQR